jgi:GDP-4-dehydro-6-deoxy-D-mannose reductase
VIDAIITGAGGFVGQALHARLTSLGQDVVALAHRDTDVCDPAMWIRLAPATTVYHLAARNFVPDSWKEAPDFLRTNVVGTEHALGYCRAHGARMVLASAYLYGVPQSLPIRETDPVRPNNPYALSKHLAEELCEFASQYQGVSVMALRLFNVFGPGQRREFLIPSLIAQLRTGSALHVMDLKPKRDYVYIDDVVDAFVLASRATIPYEALNIGTGVSHSVGELIDIIQAAAGTSLDVVSSGVERPNEIQDVMADISRSREVLGWRPSFDLRRGIAQMLERG